MLPPRKSLLDGPGVPSHNRSRPPRKMVVFFFHDEDLADSPIANKDAKDHDVHWGRNDDDDDDDDDDDEEEEEEENRRVSRGCTISVSPAVLGTLCAGFKVSATVSTATSLTAACAVRCFDDSSLEGNNPFLWQLKICSCSCFCTSHGWRTACSKVFKCMR